MKLLIVSIFTLILLFVFLFSILLSIFYFVGITEFLILIIIVGIIFFLQWLFSPYISDLIFQWLYGLKWIGIEGLANINRDVAKFVEETCRKNKIKIPKIGFIDDDNPQAFCYGSAAFNARIVFTKGIFTYLDTEEIKAVFAHEIGHIVHRDFIIMTFAAFILSLLYHISTVLIKNGDGTSNRRGRGFAILIGAIAYIFYLIGTYILLFLSRVREYYADEFSVKSMDSSDPLARALIKIAYGIIARPEEKKQQELMQGTRVLGIMDFKMAKGIGLTYISCLKLNNWEPLQKTFLFDLKNPWAFIYELNSSHPLVAKRIKRLEKFYDVSAFDFDKIEKYPIDKKKLYTNFFRDIFFEFLPIILPLFILILIVLSLTFKFPIISITPIHLDRFLILIFSLFLISFGIAIIFKTLYRYRKSPPEKTTVLEMLEDIYASPIRGKPVELEGKIIGRGVPGLILSEDMLLQDKTGLIYLNYEGLIPFFSNLIFSLFKLEKLIGKNVKAYGWFIRGLAPRVELEKIIVDGKEIKSWVRFWPMIIGIIMIAIGIGLLLL